MEGSGRDETCTSDEHILPEQIHNKDTLKLNEKIVLGVLVENK